MAISSLTPPRARERQRMGPPDRRGGREPQIHPDRADFIAIKQRLGSSTNPRLRHQASERYRLQLIKLAPCEAQLLQNGRANLAARSGWASRGGQMISIQQM